METTWRGSGGGAQRRMLRENIRVRDQQSSLPLMSSLGYLRDRKGSVAAREVGAHAPLSQHPPCRALGCHEGQGPQGPKLPTMKTFFLQVASLWQDPPGAGRSRREAKLPGPQAGSEGAPRPG